MATGEFPLVLDQTQRPRMLVEGGPNQGKLAPRDSLVCRAVFDGVRKRLNALGELSRLACTTVNPDVLLEEMLRLCLEAFPGVERAMVARVERREQRLAAQQIRLRPGVDNRRFHISRWAMTESLAKGRPVLTSEPMKGALGRSSGSQPPQVQKMVVSIRHQSRTMGLLYLDRSSSEQVFTDADLETCEAFTHTVALALRGAELDAAVRARSITDEQLEAARQVQKRFLPRTSPSLPGFTFVAHYDPCQDVGGDLYDFIPLDKDRLAIVVGDVAGKGFPAALVMAWVTSQLRVAAHQVLGPAEVMARINRSLLEARQEELFVTLFYGVLDRRKMSLKFCNAGHIPPLVRRGGMGGLQDTLVEAVELASGMPVGMLPETSFEEGEISLGKGDAVLLVSDGVTEANGDADEMYGMDRLCKAMARPFASPADMVSDLLGDLRAFSKGRPQVDDITIVALGVGEDVEDIRTTLPPGMTLVR